MEIIGSSFKLRANVPEGRKAISYQIRPESMFGRFALLLLPLAAFHLYIHFVYPAYYDDSFIGFRISRNMAHGHWLVFNPGMMDLTNTSFLYPFLNGIWYWLLGDEWGLHAAIVLDVIFHTATLAMLARLIYLQFPLLTNQYPRQFGLVLLAVMYLTSIRLTNLVTCGMESQLYGFVILLAITLYQQRHLRPCFIVGALAFWVRPEGFWVNAAIGLVYLLDRRRLPLELAFISLIVWGALLGYNFGVYGRLMPLSVEAKQNIGAYTPATRLFLLRLMLSAPFNTPWLAIPLIGLSVAGGLARPGLRLVTLWWLLYAAFFTFVAHWFFGWYRVAFLIGYFMLPVSGAAALAEYLLQTRRSLLLAQVWAGVFVLFVAYVGLVSVRRFVLNVPSVAASFAIRERQASLAAQMAKKSPSKGFVLLEPLGVIGYAMPDRLFADFPGLCSPEVLRLHKSLKRPLQDFMLRTDLPAMKNLLTHMDISTVILVKEDYPILAPSELLNGYRLVGRTEENPNPHFMDLSMFNTLQLLVYVREPASGASRPNRGK